MTVKFMIIGFTLLLSELCFATECITISGLDHDQAGAFQGKQFYKNGGALAGMECKSFGSWRDANEYLQSHPVEANSPLLILQGAHGGPGGSAACDKENISGAATMKYLRNFSKTRKVAFLSSSCFSGDLIRQQLEQDEDLDEKSISNLCIATASYFGTPATAGSNKDWLTAISEVKKGSSIEDVYKRMDEGLISSAAWSQTGIPTFFLKDTLAEGWKAIQHINTIMSKSNNHGCHVKEGKAITHLCLHPGVLDYNFGTFSALTSGSVLSRDSLQKEINFLKYQTNSMKQNLLLKGKGPSPDDPRLQMAMAQMKCQEAYIKFLESLGTSESMDELIQELATFKKSQERPKECDILSKSMLDNLKVNPAMKKSLDFQYGDVLKAFDKIDYMALSRFGQLISDYEKEKRKALKDLENINSTDPSGAEILKAMLNGAEGCSDLTDKTNIIRGMFGMDEFTGKPNPEGGPQQQLDPNHARHYGKAMRGFNLASLDEVNYKNKKDLLRREACRTFILK